MYERVLVAIDGSENGWAALDFACRLCAGSDAKLIVVHAIVRGDIPAELQRFGRQEHLPEPYDYLYYDSVVEGLAEAARERARGHGIEDITWVAEFGDPTEVVLSVADAQKADFIVMGRRGLGPTRRLLMGSVSNKVSQLAPCNCATVVA
ncbi:MAG: universal stress protein [Alphaproteobacteria bacterium]|nr:universal stress protein [Alphaproteobacteria bacterium]